MYNGRWLANKWIHIIHQNLIKEGWKFWYVNLIQTNDSVAWNVWQNGLDFRKTAQLTNNKYHAGVFGLILVPKYNVFIQNQDKTYLRQNIMEADSSWTLSSIPARDHWGSDSLNNFF